MPLVMTSVGTRLPFFYRIACLLWRRDRPRPRPFGALTAVKGR
jgi:hypothetical protein